MFGIDPASIYNKIQDAQQTQPNQFSDGNMQNPDNTSWMQPSQPTIQAPSQPNGNTGFAGNATEIAEARNQQPPMLQPGNGTAIDAVNYGWMMPSFDFGSGIRNPWSGERGIWNSPRLAPGETYESTGNFPPGAGDWSESMRQEWLQKYGKNNQKQPVQQNQQQQQGPTFGTYQGQAGWDTAKLNDPNKHDPKYDWLRAVQSVGNNKDMNAVVDFYNKNYGANNGNAKFLGGDLVDFGGGVGPVDVLFDQENKRENLWAPQWANSSFTGTNGGQAAPGQNATPMIQPNQQIQAFLNQLMSKGMMGRALKSKIMRQNTGKPGMTGLV